VEHGATPETDEALDKLMLLRARGRRGGSSTDAMLHQPNGALVGEPAKHRRT
jgi:hypothetical protein